VGSIPISNKNTSGTDVGGSAALRQVVVELTDRVASNLLIIAVRHTEVWRDEIVGDCVRDIRK